MCVCVFDIKWGNEIPNYAIDKNSTWTESNKYPASFERIGNFSI